MNFEKLKILEIEHKFFTTLSLEILNKFYIKKVFRRAIKFDIFI